MGGNCSGSPNLGKIVLFIQNHARSNIRGGFLVSRRDHVGEFDVELERSGSIRCKYWLNVLEAAVILIFKLHEVSGSFCLFHGNGSFQYGLE